MGRVCDKTRSAPPCDAGRVRGLDRGGVPRASVPRAPRAGPNHCPSPARPTSGQWGAPPPPWPTACATLCLAPPLLFRTPPRWRECSPPRPQRACPASPPLAAQSSSAPLPVFNLDDGGLPPEPRELRIANTGQYLNITKFRNHIRLRRQRASTLEGTTVHLAAQRRRARKRSGAVHVNAYRLAPTLLRTALPQR